MKKLFFIVACLASTFSFGQNVVTNNYDNQTQTEKGTSMGKDKENPEQPQSGFACEVYIPEHGLGFGIDIMPSYFVITGSYRSGETNNYITKNDAWSLGLGGHYRYWLGKPFYIEGCAGVEYLNSSIEMKINGEKSSDSDGNLAMFIEPRIGLKLGKLMDMDIVVNAGYRWDFNKFKFDKENKADCFTIGLAGFF